MSHETKMHPQPMAAIATMLTQTHQGEESNIMIVAGSLEELHTYLGTQGHTGTPDACYVSFQIGSKVEESRPIEIPGILIARQFAAKLGRRIMGSEIDKEEVEEAKQKGLVVVFGYSDDCTEYRGAIYDEVGYGELTFSKKGKFFDEEAMEALKSLIEDGTIEAMPPLNVISAKWDENGIPWTYETTIPHATFEVMEDGELFCRAIVFHTSDLK